nr:B3 domain-containing protein At4g01580-like [Lolium perenne]
MATEKIMLGSPAEVLGEGPAKKRCGRPARVGHLHEEAGPDHFLKIILKPTVGRLMIPTAFVKWFRVIPSNIIVTTNTGCNWRMTTRREGNDAFIDQGWTAFAVAHQLKVGQFLTFRKVSSLEYSVVIFDHTCTEVVSSVLNYDPVCRVQNYDRVYKILCRELESSVISAKFSVVYDCVLTCAVNRWCFQALDYFKDLYEKNLSR